GWPPLVCTGAEKLVELLVAGPGPVRRDAPFPALRLAEPAEAAQTPRRPSAADKIPQRPHPFATPRKSVYFAQIRNTAHHDRKGVVGIPTEEIHAPRLQRGRNFGDHVERTVIRRTEIPQDGVTEVLGIVVVEGAPNKLRPARH